MRRLRVYFRLPFAITGVLRQLYVQKKHLRKKVCPILVDARSTNDGTLTEDDFKKIINYYGLAVPAIIGEAICKLHGKAMSSLERVASTAQGGMTGLFDDFFDKQFVSEGELEELLLHPGTGKNSNEKLFIHFYKEALEHVPSQEEMFATLMEVHRSQIASKLQSTTEIQHPEIANITFEKGGMSLLFYRTAFLPAPSVEERELFIQLGGLMQLSNDIFDVFKDREHGIRTLVTECSDIASLELFFWQHIGASISMARETGFSSTALMNFFSGLSIGIFSRALVCLKHLKQLEKTSNNKFQVQLYTRKQLICDMEKPANLLASSLAHISLMEKISAGLP